MLRWPQIKQSHKNKFFTKLLAYSSAFHGLLCFSLFFLYSGSDMQTLIQVSSKASDVIVKFVSFQQQVTHNPPVKTGTQFTKITPKPIAKKPVANKGLPKKQVEKKIIPKKVEEQKKKQVEKKIVSKPVEKKSVENKREQKQTPKEQVIKKEQQEEVKYVTHKQLNTVLMEQVLQESIAQVWAPPAGMESTLVCHVSLTIGWDGKLLETIIEKPSGILVYDIAVEHAVEQLLPPRQLWGKTIRVAFKP